MPDLKTKKLESLAKSTTTEDDDTAEADAEDAFAQERKARAQKYLSNGAGLNQGDQNSDVADKLDAASRKRRGSRLSPNEEEVGLRDTAKKIRDLP